MLDHTKPYVEKIHNTDAELTRHVGYINLTWNGRVCVGVACLCLLCACLPNLTTLEWIDPQAFAKTKMGYISLSWNLNTIIGITSYYCVILKMVILHDAIKTIQNRVFAFFSKTRTKDYFFSKKQKNGFKKNKKPLWIVFLKPGFFQTWLSFNPFLWFSLDRTIWNKSRHYQFDWMGAAHLKYRSLALKKQRITGIWVLTTKQVS